LLLKKQYTVLSFTSTPFKKSCNKAETFHRLAPTNPIKPGLVAHWYDWVLSETGQGVGQFPPVAEWPFSA